MLYGVWRVRFCAALAEMQKMFSYQFSTCSTTPTTQNKIWDIRENNSYTTTSMSSKNFQKQLYENKLRKNPYDHFVKY